MESHLVYPECLLSKLRAGLRIDSVTSSSFPKFIFLCGEAMVGNKQTNRDMVRQHLARLGSPDVHPVISETLFAAQSAPSSSDLLTLEHMMARLSDVVLIFLESFGTAAELGAFASLPELPPKCTVFVSEQHRHAKSFLELGPLKKLRSNRGSVIYGDLRAVYEKGELWDVVERLPKQAKTLAPNTKSDQVDLASYCVELMNLIGLVGPIARSDVIPLYKRIKSFDRFSFAGTLDGVNGALPIEVLLRCSLLRTVGPGYLVADRGCSRGSLLTTFPAGTFQRLRSMFLARKFKYLSAADKGALFGDAAVGAG